MYVYYSLDFDVMIMLCSVPFHVEKSSVRANWRDAMGICVFDALSTRTTSNRCGLYAAKWTVVVVGQMGFDVPPLDYKLNVVARLVILAAHEYGMPAIVY